MTAVLAPWELDLRAQLRGIKVGDRLKFIPRREPYWWTVRARDARYIVATQQEPFAPKGRLIYTIVDIEWDHLYNGAGPGVARSSLNTLGGGRKCRTDEDCEDILRNLNSKDGFEFSLRRVLSVWEVVMP